MYLYDSKISCDAGGGIVITFHLIFFLLLMASFMEKEDWDELSTKKQISKGDTRSFETVICCFDTEGCNHFFQLLSVFLTSFMTTKRSVENVSAIICLSVEIAVRLHGMEGSGEKDFWAYKPNWYATISVTMHMLLSRFGSYIKPRSMITPGAIDKLIDMDRYKGS